MRQWQEEVVGLELPYRQRLTLRRGVYAGAPRPRVALVAGIRGDELEGLHLSHLLARWLEDHPQHLRGRVELYPGANPLGLDAREGGVPGHATDLDGNFPGHPAGLMPDRLAHALGAGLEGADLVVDVRSGAGHLREAPQVRLGADAARTLLPHALRMDLDVAWVRDALPEGSLAQALNAAGVPCLGLALGAAASLTPGLAPRVLQGLLHAWRHLGVLAPDAPLAPPGQGPVVADDANLHPVTAPAAGLFVPRAEAGEALRAGDTLGEVVSPLSGAPLARVTCPCNGVLCSLRAYPLVYAGCLVARVVDADNPREEHYRD